MMNDKDFMKAVEASGMMHFKMLPEDADSLNAEEEARPVLKSAGLWKGNLSSVLHQGPGALSVTDDGNGAAVLRIEGPSRADHWPEGSPEDGDYCFFDTTEAVLLPPLSDWRSYDRLSFEVYPKTRGMHSPMLSLQLFNEGEIRIPDRYMREGCHIVQLRNGCWNRVLWSFPALPRDLVTRLSIRLSHYGQELSMDDVSAIEIRNIRLEKTEGVQHTLGWETDPGRISYATNGYSATGRKQAVTSTEITSFSVVDAASGAAVFTGVPERIERSEGTFFVCDFTALREDGRYVLVCRKGTGEARDGDLLCGSETAEGNGTRELRTSEFTISEDPWVQACWKTIHYLYSERCGYPVGNGHGNCHSDILARHAGKTMVYNGGWHDAGDVSQQTLQTGEVAEALMKLAMKQRDSDPRLYIRLMEEAAWGIDFVLKTRFGDGFRATSAGICRWTDNLIGTMDDCAARVHDHAMENFVLTAVEAKAAEAFQELDPAISDKCLRAAIEDLGHAERVFRERGMELPILFEHTFNSSLSLYMAAAVKAAAAVYRLTGEEKYRSAAKNYGARLLCCQETADGIPQSGVFYRDERHKTIVHFNHQARTHYFSEALAALAALEEEGEERAAESGVGMAECEERAAESGVGMAEGEEQASVKGAEPAESGCRAAMRRFADYLLRMNTHALPYGMQPSGLHDVKELEDRKTFEILHLYTSYDEEKENYAEQLKCGIPVGDGLWVRQFPVWFSFRGNETVCLSDGIAAAVLGQALGDERLTDIGRDQLYWTFGRNPFCQSLMYGEGRRYPALYGALNGEMVGSLPVGIETRDNGDVPYWPIENNATYKEVWTTSAGRLIALIAELT